MQYIKRSEALQRIYSGETFDLEFVTADEKRGTGGDLIEVKDWQITGHQVKDPEPGTGGSTGAAAASIHKNPNHDQHGTINIHHPETRQVRKIHSSLIQTFNGKKILNG